MENSQLNVAQRLKLLDKGPLSVAEVMKKRLEVLNSSDKDSYRSFWNNSFSTRDGIAYHPDGRGKVVLDAQPLWDPFLGIGPFSVISGYALSLPWDYATKLEGVEFGKEDLKRYSAGYSKEDLEKYDPEVWVGSGLRQKDVRDNPIWRTLARDEKLLEDYTEAVFSQVKEKTRGTRDANKAMDLCIDSTRNMTRDRTGNMTRMLPWYFTSLESRSNAVGNGLLGYDPVIRIFSEPQGIYPGVLVQAYVEPNLEQIVTE